MRHLTTTISAVCISLAFASAPSLAQTSAQTLDDVEAQCVAFPDDCAILVQTFLTTQQALLTPAQFETLLRQATTKMVEIVENNPQIRNQINATLQVISDEAEEIGTTSALEITTYITAVTDDDTSNDPVEPLNPSPN